MKRQLLIERMARAMRPHLFAGEADELVGPATQYERGMMRRYAEQILDSRLVIDADRAKAARQAAESWDGTFSYLTKAIVDALDGKNGDSDD